MNVFFKKSNSKGHLCRKKVDTGGQEDGKPPCLQWVRQLTVGGGILWVLPLPGDFRLGRLLVVLHSPRISLTTHHNAKMTEISERFSNDDITLEPTRLCVFLWCVEVISPMSEERPPCLNVCASACANLHSPTHTSI